MTLGQQLWNRVDRTPQRAAIHLQQAGRPDLALTYEDLWRGAVQFARCFQSELVRPGEVIILVLQHGADLVYAFWGAVLYGAIPSIMPFLTEKLSPDQYAADLRALLSITQPAAIVTYPEFAPHISAALNSTNTVRTVISTSSVANADESILGVLPSSAVSESDVVLLQHSSGTTGLQKGVALSHRAVTNQLQAYGRALQLRDEDVVVSWLPLYHDMGLVAGFLLPILAGIPLVLSSPFDWVRAPWRMLHAVSEYRGTLSWLPNFAYNFMANKVRDRHLQGIQLNTWRAVINCSEPVRLESHLRFFERFRLLGLQWNALQTCYAMAENVFGVTQSVLQGQPTVESIDQAAFIEKQVARPASGTSSALQMMSSGRPLANTQVCILDAGGSRVADSVVGEIALQSDCMLTGYFNRPDADREAFRDGWYLTGDYGYLSHGELYVTGRKKDLIIVGGKNIYPHDLEALSYEIPGIHAGRSVAFGVFNEELGTEDVYMVAETDTDDAGQQTRLEQLVLQHVAKRSAVALRQVRVVGPRWIRKTSSGKTARAANRQKFLRELAQQPRS